MKIFTKLLCSVSCILIGLSGIVSTLPNVTFSIQEGFNLAFASLFSYGALIIYSAVQLPTLLSIFVTKKVVKLTDNIEIDEEEIFEKVEIVTKQDDPKEEFKDIKFALVNFIKVVFIMGLLLAVLSGFAFIGKYIFQSVL